MNKQLFILIKTNFINQFRFNDLKSKEMTRTKKNTILMAVVMPILLFVFCIYSFGLAFGLCVINLSYLVPAYALSVTGLITVFFTILKTNGILFGYQDYEILMSLPIPTDTVIASRFFTMYISNLFFTFFFMTSMGIAYAIFEKPSFTFYIYWFLGIFFAPLIPTTIATIIGAIIMATASRFKYSKVVSIVLSIALIGCILIIPLTMESKELNLDEKALSNMGTTMYETICKIYPIAFIFSKAFEPNGFLYFVLFIFSSIVIYFLFIKILSLKYIEINTNIKGHVSIKNYQLTTLESTSPLIALYKKELKRFFSSNSYILNIGMGVIMTFIFVLAFLFMKTDQLETMLNIPNLFDTLPKFMPFALSAVLTMSCTTVCSLSLEGKNLWIIKTIPVSLLTVFNSKILVNLTLTIPTSIICSTLLIIRIKPDLFSILFLYIIPIVFSIFSAVFGMFINIKMPNFEWETEITVIKQSMASMIGMFTGPLITIFCIGILFLFSKFNYYIISTIITVFILLFTFFLYNKISKIKEITTS